MAFHTPLTPFKRLPKGIDLDSKARGLKKGRFTTISQVYLSLCPSYNVLKNHSLGQRLIRSNEDFVYIDDQVMQKILRDYSDSKNRLIIIDQQGTLPRQIYSDPEPSTYILHVLDKLTRDRHNTAFVVSPHAKRDVHTWFSTHARGLGLAAEDGYQYRFNSQFKSEYEWHRLIEIAQDQWLWMDRVEGLMEHYVEKTDGAFIQRKESAIVFDFTDSDNQFGHLIARELSKQIDKLKGFNLHKVLGQSYLEVKPRELRKSLLLERIMSAISQRQQVDFLLYIGDDSSNEEVFSILKQTKKTMLSDYFKPELAHIFTCTVGKKPSKAQYFLKDSQEMSSLLRNLSSLNSHSRSKPQAINHPVKLAAQDSRSRMGSDNIGIGRVGAGSLEGRSGLRSEIGFPSPESVLFESPILNL